MTVKRHRCDVSRRGGEQVAMSGSKRRLWGQLVTGSYFSTLRVAPALGRLITLQDEQSGDATPVVISYRLWQQAFASDESVVGKSLLVNSQPVTIIGVGPKDFTGASPLLFGADMWTLISAGGRIAPELPGDVLDDPHRLMFRFVGRLRAGVTMTRAEAQLDGISQQLQQDSGDSEQSQKGRRVFLVEGGRLLPLRKQDLPFLTSFLSVLAGLIMLIACANVTNLMLARTANRRKEMAVRMAMGASRTRIVRQLLTESVILSLIAAIPGFLACIWLMRLLSQVKMPFLIPVTFDFGPDGRVLLFAIGLTTLTGLGLGLLPALQTTHTALAPALNETESIQIGRHYRISMRNVLMVTQFAGSLTLLVILGVLSIGIQTKIGIREGFDSKDLYLISLDPTRDGYSPENAGVFLDKLRDRVKALPGIKDLCLSESVPVSLADGMVWVRLNATEGGTELNVVRHVVGRDYFETAGIRVLRGRTFQKSDEMDGATAVIVSAELAKELWNTNDPIGQQIRVGDDEVIPAKLLPGSYDYRAGTSQRRGKSYEVVGVISNLSEGLVQTKPRPAMYFPLSRQDYNQPPVGGMTLIVRALPGINVIGTIRDEISAMDPNITLFDARSMDEQIDRFMAPLQIASWTYGLIGVFGLVLASIGLAGLTAYSVARRIREIAIRRALGASDGSVLGLVMKEGLILVAVGTALGALGACAGAHMLAVMNSSVGQVTATSAGNPWVLFGAPFVLALLTLVACYVPARKSMQIDPAVALRQG
jgi:predicted permease